MRVRGCCDDEDAAGEGMDVEEEEDGALRMKGRPTKMSLRCKESLRWAAERNSGWEGAGCWVSAGRVDHHVCREWQMSTMRSKYVGWRFLGQRRRSVLNDGSVGCLRYAPLQTQRKGTTYIALATSPRRRVMSMKADMLLNLEGLSYCLNSGRSLGSSASTSVAAMDGGRP